MTAPIARRSSCVPPASRSRPSPTCATGRPAPGSTPPARPASRSGLQPRSSARAAGCASLAPRSPPGRSGKRRRNSPATLCSSAAAGRLRCICSRNRAGSCGLIADLNAYLPGVSAAAERSAGGCNGAGTVAALSRRGLRGRCRGGARRRIFRPNRDMVRARGAVACATRPSRARAGSSDDKGIRRSAERRHRQGPGAGDARGVPLDRARQALHDHRHGDRSGQDLEPERARRRCRTDRARDPRGRLHHLPHAVHAGDIRHDCRSVARDAVRSGAADADPPMGSDAGRGIRGCRRLETGTILSPARRGHACGGRARVPRGSRRRRAFRCLHAGQDRSGRTGCGRIPQPHVHWRLRQNERRRLPLRADAERGRLRHG